MTQITDPPPAKESSGSKVGLLVLTGLVVGSMIGAGIFSVPQNMAAAPAAPGALMVGWIVTGVGMLALALTFQYLSRHADDPDAGLYGYVRDGFGRFVGFLGAWGYWFSAWLGSLAYLVLIGGTLGIFWPDVWGDGTNWLSIGLGSVVLWGYTALLMAGVRNASIFNTVVTIAKILPILVFIAIAAAVFDPAMFSADLWGAKEGIGSGWEQIRGMMLATVWAFLGVEGAAIFARRARRREDVGRATVIGYVLVLVLLMAVSLLSFGIMSRAELEGLGNPSMAAVLEKAVGPWGAAFIAIGLLISLAGAMLAWLLLCAEILSSTGRREGLPSVFGREPRDGVPIVGILVTTGVLQAALLGAHFLGADYENVIYLSASSMLIPYLLVAIHALRLAAAGRARTGLTLAITIVAALYAAWLIYAGGLDYLLLSSLFYAAGLPLHWWVTREKGRPFLTGVWEWVVFGALVAAAVGAIVALATGQIAVF